MFEFNFVTSLEMCTLFFNSDIVIPYVFCINFQVNVVQFKDLSLYAMHIVLISEHRVIDLHIGYSNGKRGFKAIAKKCIYLAQKFVYSNRRYGAC